MWLHCAKTARNCAFGRIGSGEKCRPVVHGVFLWQPPGMTDPTPEEELETAIAFALSQLPYEPPRKQKLAERTLYFRAVARAVRQHLAFSWVITRKPPQQIAPSEWKPGDRTPEER
jgi:hypothetical protein